MSTFPWSLVHLRNRCSFVSRKFDTINGHPISAIRILMCCCSKYLRLVSLQKLKDGRRSSKRRPDARGVLISGVTASAKLLWLSEMGDSQGHGMTVDPLWRQCCTPGQQPSNSPESQHSYDLSHCPLHLCIVVTTPLFPSVSAANSTATFHPKKRSIGGR